MAGPGNFVSRAATRSLPWTSTSVPRGSNAMTFSCPEFDWSAKAVVSETHGSCVPWTIKVSLSKSYRSLAFRAAAAAMGPLQLPPPKARPADR